MAARHASIAALRRRRERAERGERVVGDDALPHEIPQRGDGVTCEATAAAFVHRREEAGAMRAQHVDDTRLARGEWRGERRRPPQRG